jgi:hypothetical protein
MSRGGGLVLPTRRVRYASSSRIRPSSRGFGPSAVSHTPPPPELPARSPKVLMETAFDAFRLAREAVVFDAFEGWDDVG